MHVALNGKALDKTSSTVSEWMYQYLFVYAIHEVTSTTFHHYVNLYEVHIKEIVMGDIAIPYLVATLI